MLDADDAGRGAAGDVVQRLAAVNIEARAVELPVKDAAQFIAGGGLVDELRRLITRSAASLAADASAARAVRAEASGATALAGTLMQLETSNDGAMLFASDGREYRVRGRNGKSNGKILGSTHGTNLLTNEVMAKSAWTSSGLRRRILY
jgi:hypothetical protein